MLIALEEGGKKYRLSLYWGAGRLKDVRQYSWEYPGKTVTTGCINYFNNFALSALCKPFCLLCIMLILVGALSLISLPKETRWWRIILPSLQGWKEFLHQCSAESCQKQREGPPGGREGEAKGNMWEMSKAKGKMWGTWILGEAAVGVSSQVCYKRGVECLEDKVLNLIPLRRYGTVWERRVTDGSQW